MKFIVTVLLTPLVASLPSFGADGRLQNQFISWSGQEENGQLQPIQIKDKINGDALSLTGDCFQLTLGDGTVLRSSDFKMESSPKIEALKHDPNSPTLAKYFTRNQNARRRTEHVPFATV